MSKFQSLIGTSGLAIAALVALTQAALAGPCDLSLNQKSMTDAERAQIARTGIAQRDKQYGDYYVSYVFAEANYDVELAMGVYTSCGEHAGSAGLGDFIVRSDMKSAEGSNPFQVYYEQSGQWGFSGGEYTVENTVTKDGSGGYLMRSRLVWSSDAHFSPKSSDGYVRMTPDGSNKVFVIACNYMEPRDLPFPAAISRGKFNSMAKERLRKSGENLLKWVKRVSGSSSRSQSYREKLSQLVGG